MNKFTDPFLTARGDTRAWVDLTSLKTLWFNTGTLCNLSCKNCYIESTPRNDALSFLTPADILPYLTEIKSIPTLDMIGLTGGEPFINPHIQHILTSILTHNYPVLVLTNAYHVLKRHELFLKEMNEKYPRMLFLRISLDHYTKEIHEQERSVGTFDKTMNQLKVLYDLGLQISIAGRSLVNEPLNEVIKGYQTLLNNYEIDLDLKINENIVIFPEMIPDENIPEITTACWDILNKSPDDQMCATERMIVKRKGSDQPVVLPCTLLAYDEQFELGETLSDSKKRVQLNHVFCAKFCVLGGASCSSAK